MRGFLCPPSPEVELAPATIVLGRANRQTGKGFPVPARQDLHHSSRPELKKPDLIFIASNAVKTGGHSPTADNAMNKVEARLADGQTVLVSIGQNADIIYHRFLRQFVSEPPAGIAKSNNAPLAGQRDKQPLTIRRHVNGLTIRKKIRRPQPSGTAKRVRVWPNHGPCPGVETILVPLKHSSRYAGQPRIVRQGSGKRCTVPIERKFRSLFFPRETK